MFKEYDNTIVFKSLQAHPMVDVNFVKKERKKSQVIYGRRPIEVMYCSLSHTL
uniref:Uncharacterized protein n=1 Tax=Medicago truncatula TaxID=3880 RepID=I3SN34_MEDTR|nr:unknown [Medicago truncatula]